MTKHKKSITFGDAVKSSSPLSFSSMVKPIGSRCNLDCCYCYYLDKSSLYGDVQPTMSDELLEEYVKQYIESNDVPVVTFSWHGGEPLLAGIEYYQKAIEFQNIYKDKKQIDNVLQTNGVLVNEQWCDFWRENNFLIGVSIDGPKSIHDAFRTDKGGHPTFDRVMKSIEMMASRDVQYNTLTTVNSLSEGRGVEVYRFLKSIGSHYMQFLPVVEHVVKPENGTRPYIVPPYTKGSVLADWSVSSKGYGTFMNDIFDSWVLTDVGHYYVQLFDVTLANWVGAAPGLCAFSETCGDALVVEHNGDVYSCDHFVYPQYKIGNIMSDNMRDMIKSKAQFSFGVNKRNSLPSSCLRCKYYFACKGECPKHRFEETESGYLGLNTLCKGLYSFFSHTEPYMKYMAELLSQRRPPAMVMPWAIERMRNIRGF